MNDRDPVDELLHEWESVRPELDFQPMALFARCNRFVTLSLRHLESTLGDHNLSVGEFDVLSALRRSGPPFTLRPSELAERVMVTRAGMTSRVDKLEGNGLVERRRDPDDRRSEPIVLTRAGQRLVDRALVALLEREAQLFAGLTKAQQREMDTLLRRLL